MIRIFALFIWVFAASVATAQKVETPPVAEAWSNDKTRVFDATSLDIDTLIWLARPVVVFADSPNDPNFRQQMDLLLERADDLAERDVIVLTDTDPSAQSLLRTRLRPRGFGLVIIGKDGEVELRKPSPWDVREITRSIDKMPLRQQEVDDRRFEQ